MKKIFLFIITLVITVTTFSKEKIIVLKTDRISEPIYQTFRINKSCEIKVFQVVGATKDHFLSAGWIIRGEDRQKVWAIPSVHHLDKVKDKSLTYTYESIIHLEPGIYQVFYSLSKSYDPFLKNLQDLKTFISQFFDNLSKVKSDDYKTEKEFWRIELILPDDDVELINDYNPFQNEDYLICYSRLGNEEYKNFRFKILEHPIDLIIYAQGEGNKLESILYDRGWLSNSKGKTIWEFSSYNTEYAGGAMKNLRYYGNIELQPDDYTLVWMTDDTHSYGRWNETPPDDPLFWGVALKYTDVNDRRRVKIVKEETEQNEVLKIVQLSSNQLESKTFYLHEPTTLHIISIGEYDSSTDEMVDYGWIINNTTHEKVWELTVDNSTPDGSIKNRRAESQINLKPGEYTVYYVTDDSHDYRNWEDEKPLNPEMYGITIYFVGNLSVEDEEVKFRRKPIEKDVFIIKKPSPNESMAENQIINMTRVGSGQLRKQIFRLDYTAKIRIKAIGEGEDDEMFDYAWIVDNSKGKIRWKMLFENTLHAGGARKNRYVDEKIILEKGEYTVYYTTDDSHAFNDWNMTPPNTPSDYGIQIFIEETYK